MVNRQSFSRNRRLEGEIRAVLAELLRLSVKDPRLEGVTVSAIQLSADRTQASVFYSVIGDDERERQAADGFAAAAAFLRRELGQRMRLRTVPALEFHRDTSYEYGDRIERLLDRIQGEAPAAANDDADDDAGGEEP